MNTLWIKRSAVVAILAVVASGFVYALRPQPVLVDVETVKRGSMTVTVDEEGKTRIREIYQVSAPVAGKIRRSPREVGDSVTAGMTLVAVIEANDPPFLDARRARELEAGLAAAKAAVAHARTEIRKAEAELKFAQSDLKRAESLSRSNVISGRAMERASLEVDVRNDALAATRADLELRERERDSSQAKLTRPEHPLGPAKDPELCCQKVLAPVSGRVLKIVTESEQAVTAGAPLLEIGDPSDLEIVVELLSTDAVKIKAGDAAFVGGWGGTETLEARVRRVEPSGFTKVSALGIEEQRVNTILDLVGGPDTRSALGHDFRVFVRIVVWQADDVLMVPLGALFRNKEKWAVFRDVSGRAVLTPVTIGHRNDRTAEVIDGLDAGETVIVHPSDRVGDAIEVAKRGLPN